MRSVHLHRETLTALKFAAVSGLGLVTDLALLRLGVQEGLSALPARALSLAGAMQVTFLANGFLVFRCVTRRNCLRHWLGYMGTNGLGNLCNYAIFAGLVVSRWPVVSHRWVAVLIGSASAYLINYLFARLVVFGRPRSRRRGAEEDSAALCDAAAE